jgi:prevent-host-death family protein
VITIALSEAKDKLSALVDEAEREHEIVRITRHGRPAAVLMSDDDLESLRDTVFWLSQPGLNHDIAQALASQASHDTTSAAEVRAHFGLTPP